jgi:hypothetical protein
MDGARGRGKAYTRFRWANLRERDLLEDPGVDGRKTLKWNYRKWDVGVWIRSTWRVLVNAVRNLRVP